MSVMDQIILSGFSLIRSNSEYRICLWWPFAFYYVLETEDALEIIGTVDFVFIHTCVNLCFDSYGKCDIKIGWIYLSLYWTWGGY